MKTDTRRYTVVWKANSNSLYTSYTARRDNHHMSAR